MFCYQREFRLPTETVTQQLLLQLVGSPQTRWLTKEHRRWRDNMPSILADAQLQEQWAKDEEYQKWCTDQENDHRFVRKGVTRAQAFKAMTLPQRLQGYCDYLKRSLPFVVFIATYDESESVKSKKMGRWRNQKYCRLNGVGVIDFDHVDSLSPDPSPKGEGSTCTIREIWDEAYSKLSDEDKARILLVYITPSGHGLKVVFMADVNVGNLIDNQKDFSAKLGLNPDEACKDASRGAFLTTEEDIILLDERIFEYENPAFGEKYNEQYHAGKSQPTAVQANLKFACSEHQDLQSERESPCESAAYNGVPYSKILEAWSERHFSGNEKASRHEASVVLARDLYIMTDRDKQKTLALLMVQPWVKQIVEERQEDVERTVGDAAAYVVAQESEAAKKGKPWLPRISKEMKEALQKSTQKEPSLFLCCKPNNWFIF